MALIPTGVVIARSKIGAGVFADRRFRTGQTIAKLAGSIVWYEVLWKRGGKFLDNCIRFGPETYLDPGDNLGRYLNHSCAPNAAIGKERNQLFLVAAEPIAKGDEIAFDYSTTIGDDDIWTMKCHCGSRRCRKRIRKFGSLPAELQSEYIRRGMVPGYILRTLGG